MLFRLPIIRLAFGVMALALTFNASTASANEKLTVLLDWYVNADHAPLVIAQEKGFFADAGLDVELVAPSDPSAPPRLVAAGQGDIAITYQPELHFMAKEELPLKRIGTLIETPLNTVLTLADGPVKTLADLKGRSVGFSVSGFEDAVLKIMLERAGVSLDDVTLINVNFALSPALMSKQVDAVVGAYRNVEMIQLAKEGNPARAFYPEDFGVPAYDELIFIAATDKLDDPRLYAFMSAIEKAALWLTNHPNEALELYLKAYPALDKEFEPKSWFATLPRFSKRPMALDEDRYTKFAAFLKSQGLIDVVPPVADYATVLTAQ